MPKLPYHAWYLGSSWVPGIGSTAWLVHLYTTNCLRARRDPRGRVPSRHFAKSRPGDVRWLAYLPGSPSPGLGAPVCVVVLGLMAHLDPDQTVGSLHQVVGPGKECLCFLSLLSFISCCGTNARVLND